MKYCCKPAVMKGKLLGAVCPFAIASASESACTTIDVLPVGSVFSRCGYNYLECSDYTALSGY